MTWIVCPYCHIECEKPAGYVNRARATGMAIYCSRWCSGAARRTMKTTAEKKEEKRLYDAERRKALAAELKAANAEYHKRTYDPIVAAEKRKARMPGHIEYCRRPEYRRWKAEYDRQHLARLTYGEFAEAFLMLRDIETEVNQRMTRYEIYQEQGRLNKSTRRKRAAAGGSVALG